MQDDMPCENALYEPREIRVARQIAAIEDEMIALFAEPDWPEAEILTVWCIKAGMADCPRTCPKPACRRARRCTATDIGEGAACGPHWSAGMERDFEQMALGILIAWRSRCADAAMLRERIARWSGAAGATAPLPRAKRSVRRSG